MLNIPRQLSDYSNLATLKATLRSSCLAPRIECLESRLMFSITPAASEYSMDWSAAEAASIDDRSVIVAGPIAGAETGDDKRSLPPAPAGKVGIQLPWPGLPSWPPLNALPSQFPNDLPQPSGADLYTDIGDLPDVETPVPFDGTVVDQEARSLLELLSQLSYLPPASRARAMNPEGLDETELVERRPDANQNQKLIHLPAASEGGGDSNPSNDVLSEGGMISIMRHTVDAESSLMEATPVAGLDSLLESAVEMDSVYGKFQAFEVSAEEDATPPLPSSETNGANTSRPPLDSEEAIHVAAMESVLNSSLALDVFEAMVSHVNDDVAREEPIANDIPTSSTDIDVRGEHLLPSQYEVAAALGIALVTCAARAVLLPNANERDHSLERIGIR